MPTPEQVRGNTDRLLSIVILHNSGKLKTWSVFPSLFTGNYTKHRDVIEVLTGREIQVKFDRPVSLELDENTISDADFYSTMPA